MYTLTFAQHFDRERGQDYGRLLLKWIDDVPEKSHDVEIWVSTSSHRSLQDAEDFHSKGGIIPPSYRCPKLKSWLVETNPINLSHVKGIEGNFYKINPHLVTTDKGGVRGDFGIHLDANVEGSLGCIVMNKRRFDSFEKRMKEIRRKGFSTIPLTVIYS